MPERFARWGRQPEQNNSCLWVPSNGARCHRGEGRFAGSWMVNAETSVDPPHGTARIRGRSIMSPVGVGSSSSWVPSSCPRRCCASCQSWRVPRWSRSTCSVRRCRCSADGPCEWSHAAIPPSVGPRAAQAAKMTRSSTRPEADRRPLPLACRRPIQGECHWQFPAATPPGLPGPPSCRFLGEGSRPSPTLGPCRARARPSAAFGSLLGHVRGVWSRRR